MNTNVSKHDLNYFWSQPTARHHPCSDKKSGGFVVAALGVRMPALTPLLTAVSEVKHASCHSICKIKTAMLHCHWGESRMATFSLFCELLEGERPSGDPPRRAASRGPDRPAMAALSGPAPPRCWPRAPAGPVVVGPVATGRARPSRHHREAAEGPKSEPGPGGSLLPWRHVPPGQPFLLAWSFGG